MKTHIYTAGLLAAAALALQGCTYSAKISAQNDAWQNCPENAGPACPSKKLSGEPAKALFDALTGAGAEENPQPGMRTISVHETACSKTAGKYDCSFKYHKPSTELTPRIDIEDGDAAKRLYQALAAAGVREDRAGPSLRITVTSIGCMASPPECILAKNAYEEVAW